MKKNLFFALFILLGFASCEKSDFNVNINLKNTDENTMVYLQKIVDNKAVMVDSAVFKDETAILTAPKDDAQMLYFIKIKGMRGTMEFFPENQDVTVVGDLNNPRDVEIFGGEAQTKYTEYRKGYEAFNSQISELYKQLEEAYHNNDTVTIQQLNEQGNAVMEQQTGFFDNFITKNADHFLSHYLLCSKKQDYPLDELKKIVDGFTSEDPYTQDLRNYIAKQESLQVGRPLVDFTLKTAEGQEITLSEYIQGNKLTLVDFWASWCGPCRGENPFVVAAYEKYHEKGFNVLGVSLDQDANAWQNAIEKDKLTWTQVRDVEGKAAEMYLIYYIPSNILIDENGIIIEKNLRGEQLEGALGSRL